MKRSAAALASLAVAAGAVLFAPPATAHAPYCGLVWGSLPEAAGEYPTRGEVYDVRTGRHECFDRLVFDVSGEAPGYRIRYVDQVTQDGSGFVVPVEGGAKIEVTVLAWPVRPVDPLLGPDEELADVTSYRTFRDVQLAGAYEGYTTVGLGVRARLPFRVFTLEGPGAGSRVVVDVAHQW
jgi:hypothetical protein